MSKSFAALWQRDRWRYALPVAGWSLLALASIAAPVGWGIAAGAIGLHQAALAASIALAGAGLRVRHVKQRGDTLNETAPLQAPQPLQDIAANLFRKAGLPCTPCIRLLPESNAALYGMRHSIGIAPAGAKTNGSIPIILGSQILKRLSIEEMTAMLAHATARLMIRPPAASPACRVGKALETALILSSVLTLNVPMLAIGLSAAGVRRFTMALARFHDDAHADRNALALFPNPAALTVAKARTQEIILDTGHYEFSRFRQFYRFLQSQVFAVVPMAGKFAKMLAESAAEVADFYKDSGLPANGADILTPALKVAWQESRMARFRMPLPVSSPAKPPETLRRNWPDSARQAPCREYCICIGNKPAKPPAP